MAAITLQLYKSRFALLHVTRRQSKPMPFIVAADFNTDPAAKAPHNRRIRFIALVTLFTSITLSTSITLITSVSLSGI
jgi:hypothetical protein